MSPDSSMNSVEMSSTISSKSQQIRNAAAMVSVQVQECSQSQALPPLPPPSAVLVAQQQVTHLQQTQQPTPLQQQSLNYHLSSGNQSVLTQYTAEQQGPPTSANNPPLQRHPAQTNVIYKMSPDYSKTYPVMDTTVASSVKGEPDLNIGMYIRNQK